MAGSDEEAADDECAARTDEAIADPTAEEGCAQDECGVDAEECSRVTLAEALPRSRWEGAILGPDEEEDEDRDHAVEGEALPHLDHGEREHAAWLLLFHAAIMQCRGRACV